jgi:hypothetical protein
MAELPRQPKPKDDPASLLAAETANRLVLQALIGRLFDVGKLNSADVVAIRDTALSIGKALEGRANTHAQIAGARVEEATSRFFAVFEEKLPGLRTPRPQPPAAEPPRDS